MRRHLAAVPLAALALSGCGAPTDPTVAVPSASPATGAPAPGDPASGDPAAADPAGAQRFPDVLAAEPTRVDGETWSLEVTVSSPYDSPQRYADGWRVLAPDGSVLGEHALAHDHAGEQPFTRTQPRVRIPAGVDRVTVQGRDLVHGYGGGTVTVPLPG